MKAATIAHGLGHALGEAHKNAQNDRRNPWVFVVLSISSSVILGSLSTLLDSEADAPAPPEAHNPASVSLLPPVSVSWLLKSSKRQNCRYAIVLPLRR